VHTAAFLKREAVVVLLPGKTSSSGVSVVSNCGEDNYLRLAVVVAASNKSSYDDARNII